MSTPRPKCLGLRIDVDTGWGARLGLPRLLKALAAHSASATVFVPSGPDQSWKALHRIFRQRGYLRKLVRTNALIETGVPSALAALFLRKSPLEAITASCLETMSHLGCELGAHGFSHTDWHNNYGKWQSAQVSCHITQAVEAFKSRGLAPVAWASPGWQYDFKALLAQEGRGWRWSSDVRGVRPFIPRAACVTGRVVQIPVSLPSLDEFQCGLPPTESEINKFIGLLETQEFPVYAAHTELDGWRYLAFFERLLAECHTRSIRIVTLSHLMDTVTGTHTSLPEDSVVWGSVPGRSGLVALQAGDNRPSQ